MNIESLKKNPTLLDEIDWEMTPEKAVETFLEWGTGWSRHRDAVRYPGQEAYYFLIYDWEDPPQVTLVRENAQGREELAKVEAPSQLVEAAIDEAGKKPGVGVCAINDQLKAWLRSQLGI